jgi:hypothetical protein
LDFAASLTDEGKMRVWRRLLILATFLIAPPPAAGQELILEWTQELAAGSHQWAVEHYLQDRGIDPVILKDGLTYTSRITTPQRDYLFCNERLFGIVEGDRVDGAKFNFWMTAFLTTHKEYGDPTEVEYEDTWRQIKFNWMLDGDNALYFLVRGAPPDGIIWSRELIHEPSGRPCQ